MIRIAVLALAFAVAAPAWVESVEFPWNACPPQSWESQLVWLKNIGITHVSLPPSGNPAQLSAVLTIIRRLGIEADLEGSVPDELQPLTRAHGGPLTDALSGPPVRISALDANATTRARELIASGAGALLWTDVEETLGPAGYRPGAVGFAGEERPASTSLRRNAQLSQYWNRTFSSLHEAASAAVKPLLLPATPGITVRQFAGDNGTSVVSIVNKSAKAWVGELRVLYPAVKRLISVPGVTVPAHDALWLPVGVPLTDGPLCRDCSAFGKKDHIVYASEELTGMEYENGILAMEFAAPAAGEVILQLSREPSGPLVAGGRPAEFIWDEHTLRARLKIPAGSGPAKHVRIGIAIEPPDATAFFDSARVLTIGETNYLTAQFSSEAIAQRSRLRMTPEFPISQDAGKQPLALTYAIKVPATAVHGDHAELWIEADGRRMSHAGPQFMRPVSLRFPDAITVHLAADSALALSPATIAVNQRTGRDLIVTIRNNAPEIRNFAVELKAEGLDFSPAKLEVTVGVSAARDLSFRVFVREATAGMHAGSVVVSGAASVTEPLQFVVLPQSGAAAYQAAGFSFIESLRNRASFVPGRWLEFINKENDQNLLPAGGAAFDRGPIDTRADSLLFDNQKTVTMADLEQLARKARR